MRPAEGSAVCLCDFRRAAALKNNEAEFMQYRNPVGGGPSLKTWPRWPSQRAHATAVRSPKLKSSSFRNIFLGKRLPEAGPASAGIKLRRRGKQRRSAAHTVVQPALVQVPIGTRIRHLGIGPAREISKAFAESWRFHSASLLTIFGTRILPVATPCSENPTISTSAGGPLGTVVAACGEAPECTYQTATPASAAPPLMRNARRLVPWC